MKTNTKLVHFSTSDITLVHDTVSCVENIQDKNSLLVRSYFHDYGLGVENKISSFGVHFGTKSCCILLIYNIVSEFKRKKV